MAIKFLNTVQVDTDVLYVDASTNKVGIGTTSPSTVLEVSSSGVNGVDISQSASNASQSGRLFFTTNTASEGFALFNSNGTFQVNSGGIPNNTSGTNRISIIGSSGNVGIGTTSPKAKLHVVNGTSGATWTATTGTTGVFESSTSDRSFVTITGEDEAELWFGDFTTQAKGRVRYQTDTNVMSLWTNGTPKITIDATANVGNLSNVGIGTTSMTTISSAVATLSLGSIVADVSGGIAFQANGVVKAYNYVANNYLISNTVSGIGQIFYGAGSEQMRIHNTTGNIGIGTTNPGAKLDVDGNIIVSGGVSNENDGVRVTNPGGASFITQTSSVTGAIKITLPQAGVNTMMRMEVKVYEYLTNESFTVQCGGYSYNSSQWTNEFAYIESSAKDDRNFTVRFGYNGSKSCIYIGELGSTWSYPQVFVTEFQGGFQRAEALRYQDGWDISFEASAFQGVVKTQADTQVNNWARSGTNTYYASSTGGVGIMTSSPSTSLTLGTGSSGISFQSSSTTLNSGKIAVIKQIELGNGNGNLTFETYQGGSGGGERMRILNNGNVGIGTTTPYSKLQVASATGSDVPTAGNATGGLFVSNTNKTYGINMGVSGSGWGFIQSQRADGLTNLYDLNLQPLGGDVGIGMTSPSFQLQLSTNSAAKPSSNVWTVTSDSRVKENIRDYTTGLEAILKIEPKLYDYNGKAGFEKTKNNIGIIAQDIQKVMPETVNAYNAKLNEDDAEDTELLSFDGHAVTFALINAVKDLKAEIEELKKQINK